MYANTRTGREYAVMHYGIGWAVFARALGSHDDWCVTRCRYRDQRRAINAALLAARAKRAG